MIEDNLPSHICESVVRRHQIKFIHFPLNLTHLTQPLDTAYFKPFKFAWHNSLNGFPKTKLGQQEANIPKDIFPKWLHQLIIVPLDATQLLFSYLGLLSQTFMIHRQQGKGESISLTPLYHLHPLHKYLDIFWAITVESSPLHIASSRTRTRNLWFPSASR